MSRGDAGPVLRVVGERRPQRVEDDRVLLGDGQVVVLDQWGTTPAFSYCTPLWISSVASPPSSRIMFGPIGPSASRNVKHLLGGPPVLRQRLALPGEHRHARGSSGVPCGPTTTAAAAWSWVEKMLHDAQRTSAPRLTSVSISTAVCTVMCSEPEMRAPASGRTSAYSRRSAIRPGISCSARVISLRPNSASERSATAKSMPLRSWKRRPAVSGAVRFTGISDDVVMGSMPPRRARCGPGRTSCAVTHPRGDTGGRAGRGTRR